MQVKSPWKFALIVAGLLALGACNPAPRYARPPAPAPAAFKEIAPSQFKEGAGWKLAEPADDHLRAKWWEVYNDPELNGLEEQVRISNQTVAQAEANYRAAQSLVAYARASLLPRLTTSPAYSRSRASRTTRGVTVLGGGTGTTGTSSSGTGSTTGTTGSGASTGTTGGSGVGATSNVGVLNNYSLPFSLSYEVDLWHRIRNTVAVNAFAAQVSAADVATALLSTEAQLAQDYFELRELDAQRGILTDTVNNYRDTLRLTDSRFRGGIASDEDVSQAQTQLDTAIAQLTDLGVARATYEHAIATLIGKPPAALSISVAPFRADPPAVPVVLPSTLLERRPDIAAAERSVAEANAQIGVQRAAFFPTLTLSATAGLQTSKFNQWFTWPSNFWSLGPNFAQTLFDAGARHALTAQAQAQMEGTVASYRQTVLAAFQSIEDYLSTLRILSQEAGEQHTAVESANHFLQLSLTRYRGGVDSYLNVITAQNAVLTNRQTELQVQLRQMLASVSLVQALGGGWDASQLPNEQQLRARPPKATGAAPPLSPAVTQQLSPSAIQPPNPPALPAAQPNRD